MHIQVELVEVFLGEPFAGREVGQMHQKGWK